jgi:hypothetical protein
VVNAPLVKRVPVPREMVPIAAVISNCVHLAIQLALLLAMTLFFGLYPNRFWLWLLPLWILYVAFVCGLSLISSAVSVFIRDTQYVVESFNVVLFWLVPVFYSFDIIPQQYKSVYQFNHPDGTQAPARHADREHGYRLGGGSEYWTGGVREIEAQLLRVHLVRAFGLDYHRSPRKIEVLAQAVGQMPLG